MSSLPLQPTKQLPATPINPLKRTNPDMADKRDIRPRVMLTPPGSEGHVPSDDIGFKVPAVPHRMRLMTPSSSTVAASSSPAPTSSPNAPRKRSGKPSVRPQGETIRVELELGCTYVFGRHRHHDAQVTSTTSLPPAVATCLSQSSNTVRTIFLPRQASHASRLHAAVEYIASTEELRIVVAGQNGVKLRSKATKKRIGKGESVTIKREDEIKLDFYGCTALIIPPRSIDQESTSLFSPLSSPVRPNLASLPPSSPPVGPASDAEDLPTPLDRASSPLSPVSEKAVDPISQAIKAEMLEETAAPPTPSRPASRAASPVKVTPPVPADLDLPALIASTVVFSGSSKLSLPDMVKHMLEVGLPNL